MSNSLLEETRQEIITGVVFPVVMCFVFSLVYNEVALYIFILPRTR